MRRKAQCPPGMDDKVMHSSFKIGDTVVMATRTACAASGAKLEFKGISLTLNPKTEAECERLFNALAEGGRFSSR